MGTMIISVITNVHIRIPSVEPISRSEFWAVSAGVGVSVGVCAVIPEGPKAALMKANPIPTSTKKSGREDLNKFFMESFQEYNMAFKLQGHEISCPCNTWRRGRDSNPRTLAGYTHSRRAR